MPRQSRRHKTHGFDPLVGKIPWRREWELAWGIPWTEEPGRLQSMGSQRVRYDWSDLVHTCTYKIKKKAEGNKDYIR